MKDKYRYLGPVYDLLGTLYSGKSIQHCKNAMLDEQVIGPGSRVLFAGVGHGRDAIHAARLGADVTVVDLSETMLRKFEEVRQAEAPDLDIRKIHSDILKVEEAEQYDMVIANFFLNVFDEQSMEKVLQHLITMTKPGGKVVVGDFAPPSGNILARSFKAIYWYAALSLFCLLANNAFHSIYNYPVHMRRLGLKVVNERHYKLLNMNCFWSILGEKPA